jgi:hypothetical protein
MPTYAPMRRIIASHPPTLGLQCPCTHPSSGVILRTACNIPITVRSVSSSMGVGGCGASLSIVGSLAIVRGTDDDDDGHCSFPILCFRLRVSSLPSWGGRDSDGNDGNGDDAVCEMVVASCACWSAARSASRRARMYSRTQRWLYGWCVALAGKSSSRISSRLNDLLRFPARVRVWIVGLVAERRRSVAAGWSTAFRGL